MTRYRQTPTPTTSDIGQLERWLREETGYIENSTDDIYTLAEFIATLYQIAGYGGIGLDAVTGLSNIGTAWQQLPFDVILLLEPRGITYDIPGDGMALNEPGVWRFNAKVSLTFAEANQGRQIQLSLWDISGAQAIGPTFNFFVGRNTSGVNLNFNLMFDITQFVDQGIGLAVRSESDSYTGVEAIGSIFDINHVSEYKGDLFAGATEAGVRSWQ